MTLTANFPFSLVESQSTKLKERFESVKNRARTAEASLSRTAHEMDRVMNLLQVCLGAALRQTPQKIMGLRPMGGPLSYKQQTQVRFLQLRLAGRQLCFGNIAQLVAATAR